MAKKRTEAEVTFIANDDGLKSTLKEISAELTKNRAELKLEQAQLIDRHHIRRTSSSNVRCSLLH